MVTQSEWTNELMEETSKSIKPLMESLTEKYGINFEIAFKFVVKDGDEEKFDPEDEDSGE